MSVEQKFLRLADYYNTLHLTRQQLMGAYESRVVRKREKIFAHARLVAAYHSLDGVVDEE